MWEEGSNQNNPPAREEASDGAVFDSKERNRVEHLIDELKHRTAELEQANRELRRVSHYRSLFLGRMSHELRTPLTSILGFSEILLEQEKLNDDQRRFCKKIQDSGLQLQASLNQLLDLSRIEAGQTELFLQEFSLREALRDTCAAVARLAQRHQIKIEYDLAPEQTMIVSDQGRLRQILYSFLAWCVSRSPAQQSILLRARVDEPFRLQISVEDSGDRIDDLSRVFEPDDKPGRGDLRDLDALGVIIGRQLLDLMGGTVTLENREGTGVRVNIELPARPAK